MSRTDAANAIPAPPSDVAVHADPRLREWLNLAFAMCVTDLPLNEAEESVRLVKGLPSPWSGPVAVFSDPWPEQLYKVLRRALVDVRNDDETEDQVGSNGGAGLRRNGCAMIPRGLSVFQWFRVIADNLRIIGREVEAEEPYTVTETGPGMREIGKRPSENDDPPPNRFKEPSESSLSVVPSESSSVSSAPDPSSDPSSSVSSTCYAPPTGPGDTVEVTFAGVNANRCTGCYADQSPPTVFTQYHEFTALGIDGTYNVPYSSQSATRYVYVLNTGVRPTITATDHDTNSTCASGNSPATENCTIQIQIDKATCRVVLCTIGFQHPRVTYSGFSINEPAGIGTGGHNNTPLFTGLMSCGLSGGNIPAASGGSATVVW